VVEKPEGYRTVIVRIPASKRVTIYLSAIILLLLAVCAKLYWDYSMLSLQTEFARDQIEIFTTTREQAKSATTVDAAEALRYAVRYYPSGTKQITGPRLDKIVEAKRAETVRAILDYLRTKTGEDLGKDPERWIEKFGKK
jgi:hypothetical protein